MQHEPVRVLHMIATLNVGGSQSFVMNLYRAIDRKKVQFDFIIDHLDGIELKDEVEALGGKVYVLPEFKGINTMQVCRAWDVFFKTHPEYKILHTHSRSYASLYLPIARKNGLITIAHSHSTSNGKGLSSVFKRVLQYPLRYQADYIMACSEIAGRWLFGKIFLKKGIVVKNAINTRLFQYDADIRQEVRARLGIKDDFVIGNVGRLDIPKNHSFLLHCFSEVKKKVSKSKLLLVGDGALMNSLRNEARNLNILSDILFVGSQIDVAQFYQAMDVFAFPSLWEGLGIAVIEAQASGLTCVVSENVPKETNLNTGLVKSVPLRAGTLAWAEYLLAAKGEERKNRIKQVKAVGYDISENAGKMQQFYLAINGERN